MFPPWHDKRKSREETEPEDTRISDGRRGSQPFDEYGGELARDARIWPTYVKEAENWDEDMVNGWNRSLDVILVFAALFSAISTAFVIESTKNLKQDPSESAAATLQEVSTLLRAMAQGQLVNSTANETTEYVPSLGAVYVNALWFLSLSLSVCISLVAMLAKQWSYSYMSGRTGQPHIQARQRQRRLDGLERWKLPEILAFLPTLMHLSLVLFFVGLTIYLWDIHIGVAVPVLGITAVTVIFYAVTTILPLSNAYCPYNTPLSRLIYNLILPFDRCGFLVPQYEPDSARDLRDEITSRALSWLITHSQDEQSVDLALQAVAGADPRMPVEPLIKSNVVTRLAARFSGCFSVDPKSGLARLSSAGLAEVASLYGRSLTFVLSYAPDQATIADELKVATGTAEDKRPLLIDAGYRWDIEQTRENTNIAAYGLASMAMWREFWARVGWPWPDSYLTNATSMLQTYIDGKVLLHPSAVVTLVQAMSVDAARWLNPRAPQARGSVAMILVQLLVHNPSQSARLGPAIALTLASFELAIQDYPGGVGKPSAESRMRRAQDVIRMYGSGMYQEEDGSNELLVFGLLGLLINFRSYRFVDEHVVAIATRLRAILKTDMNNASLPFLPPSFDLNQHFVRAIQFHLAPLLATRTYLVGEEARAELLNTLTVASHLWAHNEQVYAILARTFCDAQTENLQQSCLTAISSQWKHTPATKLLRVLFDQGAFKRLMDLIESNHPTMSPMAMIASWKMVSKTLELTDDSTSEQTDRPAFDARLALKLVKNDGLFSTLASQFKPADNARASIVGPHHVEMWFEPFEALSREFPHEIGDSDVLSNMAEFYESNTKRGVVRPVMTPKESEVSTADKLRTLSIGCKIEKEWST